MHCGCRKLSLIFGLTKMSCSPSILENKIELRLRVIPRAISDFRVDF